MEKQNLIEIHILTYNEEIMLPFTIAHYKKMFGNPVIIVHDNNSTDKTVEIALSEGCYVVKFDTQGMNDTIQAQIKSKAVKEATAKWILCIDADEECLIDSNDLKELEDRGVGIVKFEGWNIFDQVSSPFDIKEPMGVICTGYGKPVLIRTAIIDSIEFSAGAHSINSFTSKGGVTPIYSTDEFKLLHYKHWSCDWNIKRSAELGSRQSSENLQRRHSYHFAFPVNVHQDYFNSNYDKREIIRDKKLGNG